MDGGGNIYLPEGNCISCCFFLFAVFCSLVSPLCFLWGGGGGGGGGGGRVAAASENVAVGNDAMTSETATTAAAAVGMYSRPAFRAASFAYSSSIYLFVCSIVLQSKRKHINNILLTITLTRTLTLNPKPCRHAATNPYPTPNPSSLR